jgi:hypothetical protein
VHEGKYEREIERREEKREKVNKKVSLTHESESHGQASNR